MNPCPDAETAFKSRSYKRAAEIYGELLLALEKAGYGFARPLPADWCATR